MGQNRGKDFERVVREAFEKINDCFVMRLPDQMNGFAGGSNICDFIVYRRPVLFLLECKSCYGNTLSFSNITDTQWKGLVSADYTAGIRAGVLVWFIDHDVTFFVSGLVLESMKNKGKKSIRFDDWEEWSLVKLDGKKKRVFFEYDANKFLWEML